MSLKIEVSNWHVGVALLIANKYNKEKLSFTHANAKNLAQRLERLAYRAYVKTDVKLKDFETLCNDVATHKYPDTVKRIIVYFTGKSGEAGTRTLMLQDANLDCESYSIDKVISLFKPDDGGKNHLQSTVRMFFFDLCLEDEGSSGLATSKDASATLPTKASREANIFMAYGFTSLPYTDKDSWTFHLTEVLKTLKDTEDIYDTFTEVHKRIKETDNDNLKTPFFTSRGLGEIVCFKDEEQAIKSQYVFRATQQNKNREKIDVGKFTIIMQYVSVL